MKNTIKIALGSIAGAVSPIAYWASANNAAPAAPSSLSSSGTARNGFTTATNASGLANGDVGGFLAMVIQWMLYIIGFLSVIMIIVAGVMYVTSSGDTEQVDKAKKTLIYAIVGLVVALLGSILINTVLSWMGNA